jgi:hypothetical protein
VAARGPLTTATVATGITAAAVASAAYIGMDARLVLLSGVMAFALVPLEDL